MKAAGEMWKDHGHPCDTSLREDISPTRFSRLLLSGLIATSVLIMSGGKVHGGRPDKEPSAAPAPPGVAGAVHAAIDGDVRGVGNGFRHCPAGVPADQVASKVQGDSSLQSTDSVMVIDEKGIPRLWPIPRLAAGRGPAAVSPGQ